MRKILLVDDEPWLIESLAAALESGDIQCVIARDMTEGAKALRELEICALVTDVMMPPGGDFPKVEAGESGFHFIEHVQANWPRLPIVCLSVIADQAKIRFLMKRGVRYLRKGETPLSTAVEVITAVAEGRRVRVRQ
jgi:DNA-binding NarL/FixJ family response regulator